MDSMENGAHLFTWRVEAQWLTGKQKRTGNTATAPEGARTGQVTRSRELSGGALDVAQLPEPCI